MPDPNGPAGPSREIEARYRATAERIGRMVTLSSSTSDRTPSDRAAERAFIALAGIGQERMRQALTAAKGRLEVAMGRHEAGFDVAWAEKVELALEQLEQASKVLELYLDPGQACKASLPQDPQVVDLGHLIDRLTDGRAALQSRGSTAAHVLADPNRLSEVLQDLLGWLEDQANEDQDLVADVEVADGMVVGRLRLSPWQGSIEHLMRPLSLPLDLDQAMMGAAMARAVIEQHGGCLEVDEGSKGAGYVIRLPTAGDEA